MVARNSKDATVSIYGFGGNGAQIQIGESIGIPSDGEWHVYSVNCAQFDSFDLLYENETANVFSRSGGSSCEICAAFLMRNTGASNKLIVAPAIEKMDGEGGDFLMNVRTNTAWSASCNKQWVTLSQSRGEGNSIVEVSVAPNDGLVKDTALIEVSSADGEAKIMKVVREGNFWSTLNAQSLSVYKMDDATFNRVSNKVAVDLRPNYEYIMLYDWEGQGLQATSEPNPFGGRTDWYSFNSGNNGWAGGGTALYWDEEDPRYDNDITNTFNACVTALHGRESQWELVMILKNTGVPRVEVQLTGFGEGVQIFKFESDNSSNTHVMDVPNDNQWHEYAISCSELGSYDFPIDGQSHPIFCETVGNEGSIMVCAAFLRKR